MKKSNKFKNGLKKVGKYWHYHVKIHGKTFHGSTRCELHEDATKWLQAFRSNASRLRVGAGTPPTLEVLLEIYLRENLRAGPSQKKTFELAIRRWVLPLIGKRRVDLVRQEDITGVYRNYLETLDGRGKRHSDGGARKLMIDLKAFLNFPVKKKLIRSLDITVDIPKVQARPIQAIPISMVAQFLDAADAITNDPQISLAIRLMLFMGFRIGEIIGMRWDWVRPDWSSYCAGQTKGKEAEYIPLVGDLGTRLKAWRLECEACWSEKGMPLPETVFWDCMGKPRSQSFTNKTIKLAAKNIGLLGSWSPHRLRSSCATMLGGSGANAFTIKKVLRHKDLSTSLRYADVSESMMRESLERMYAKSCGGEIPRGDEALEPDLRTQTVEAFSWICTRIEGVLDLVVERQGRLFAWGMGCEAQALGEMVRALVADRWPTQTLATGVAACQAPVTPLLD